MGGYSTAHEDTPLKRRVLGVIDTYPGFARAVLAICVVLAIFGVIIGYHWLTKPTGAVAEEELRRILRCFDKVARANNIPYYLDYGTLLGSVREGGIIHGDPDMDVALLTDGFERMKTLGAEINQCGAVLTTRDHWSYIPSFLPFVLRRSALHVSSSSFSFLYLDIADLDVQMIEGKKYIVDTHYPDDDIRFLYDDIFPLQQCQLDGIDTFCPRNAEKMLVQLYGKTWRIPTSAHATY